MITINYQTFGNKGFQLRLRLYQSGETKFINVTKLLKGAIQKRHWNQRKQLFIPSCPFSDENNAMLVQFRQRYDEMAINWTGSVFGMIAAMDDTPAPSEAMTVAGFIQVIVGRLNEKRHTDGTIKGSFEGYEKLERRIKEFCKYKKSSIQNCLSQNLQPIPLTTYWNGLRKCVKARGVYIFPRCFMP